MNGTVNSDNTNGMWLIGCLSPISTQRSRAWTGAVNLVALIKSNQQVNGHFRDLNWRYLPYIRPM